MSLVFTEGKALVDIVLAQIEELGSGGTVSKTYNFKTNSEAGIQPYLSEGTENTLRVKNEIIASTRTEDIVIGYDITLTQNELIAEVLALVDGGTVKYDELEPTKVIGYSAPAAGIVVNRKAMNIILYTAEKDTAGDIIGYVKLKFVNGKGTPVSYTLKDGEFFIPQMVIKTRPKTGALPVDIDFVDALPVA